MPKKQNLKNKGNDVGNLTGKIQEQRLQDNRTRASFASLASSYRSFSLTWSVAMQISWNKGRFLHEKSFQSPQDFLGTPTWPLFHCFIHQYGRRDVM